MLWFWALCLATSIVYLAPPGFPQPADGLMALMLVIMLTGYFVKPTVSRDLLLCAAPFLAYAMITNLVWFALELEKRFVLSALYYPYNFGAVVLVASLVAAYGWDSTARYSQWALGFALVCELIAIHLRSGSLHVEEGVIVRSVGTFSNPNQLGYWALTAGSCWMVACGSRRLRWPDLAMLGVVMAVVMASLSKAAILSTAVLALSALWFQGTTLKLRLSLATLSLAGLIMVLPQMEAVLEYITTTPAAERLANIGGQKDDSAGGRGYDRIWLYPQYLVLGAGEGDYKRFALSKAAGNEIHSTFGTVLYCYGIIGAGLFALMLFGIFRHAELRHLAYAAPLALYGLTHQGLRTTTLWVFLGFVYGHGAYARRPSGHGATLPSMTSLPGEATMRSSALVSPRAGRPYGASKSATKP
jgi:hypothetical protein